MAQKDEKIVVGQDNPQTAGNLPVTIQAQYIKDLSIENPHAPDILGAAGGKPSVDMSFALDAKKIRLGNLENTYETVFGVRVKAERDGKIAFLVEMQYAVVTTIGPGVADDMVHPLLLIEMPRYAFPFVRQIIGNITEQAGFVPLLLTPIDFKAFYAKNFAQQKGGTNGQKAAV